MGLRVAEQLVPSDTPGVTLRLRVDLHGVSCFGPGEERTLLRWEWIESITTEEDRVVVCGGQRRVVFPSGVFGLSPAALAAKLTEAGSIFERGDVIEELGRPR